MNLVTKLILDPENVTDYDIENELYEICDREHSGCNDECPVYEANGNKIPWDKDLENCICFKSGSKMKTFIEEANLKKIECTCGNTQFGFDCVCEFVAKNPGDNCYDCEYCGMYHASKPRCNKCVEGD